MMILLAHLPNILPILVLNPMFQEAIMSKNQYIECVLIVFSWYYDYDPEPPLVSSRSVVICYTKSHYDIDKVSAFTSFFAYFLRY